MHLAKSECCLGYSSHSRSEAMLASIAVDLRPNVKNARRADRSLMVDIA